jgi:uncharacterized protein with FMN-binding domain
VGERKAGNNLLAMGTTAVLAIYATGYTRTEGAAQKAAESEGHRGTPPPPPAVAQAFPGPSAPEASKDAKPEAGAAAAESTDKADASVAAKVETPVSADAKVVAKPDAAAKTTTAAPAAAAPAPVVPTKPAFPAADSAIAPPWSDGQYFGWGRSRHGDIYSGVEIVDGKIARAWVQGCYTRYSCERIATLIPQVAERQNPEIDNISGATQSSDAFYYGVVEALGHAKGK